MVRARWIGSLILNLIDPLSSGQPGGRRAGPYGTATDSQDRIWFVHWDGTPGKFTGFDSKTESFVGSTQIPSFANARNGTVRHMDYDPTTGSIWFGTDTGYIGRAIVEPR